ncbi:MAG: DUF805 domain-containing protein [Roseovarius sp.]
MKMDLQTSVKTCLTEKYAAFSGRASRPEYWWFILAYVIGAVIFAIIGIRLLYLLYVVALIVPLTAAGWRRLQDTGRPGWYILIPVGFGLLTTLFAPRGPGMGMGQMGDPGQIPDMGNAGLMMVLGLIQLAITVVYLWWLTRPSDPEANAYGPKPRA